MSTLPDPDRVRLLAEADLLLAFARMLSPPDAGLRGELAALAEAGSELAAYAGVAPPPFGRCLSACVELGAEWLAAQHTRLFDGAIACQPNETAYVRRDKGAILGDIAGFYRAFGFEPRRGRGEKQDHVATELEFLAMLRVMQAQAPDGERATIAAEAAAAFAGEHLGAFLPRFVAALAGVGDPFHEALAEGLGRLWAELASRHGLSVDGGETPAAVVVDDEGPSFSCGPCGGPD
jgi:nitrate reductase assembly molybdenum cofactor insertion protein NarJ